MGRDNPRKQKGATLLVVCMLVLLAALLVTSALRTAWLNELGTGTEADYQRALGNAQALLRDAELGLQRRAPPTQFEPMRARLASQTPSCSRGICVPEGVAEAFWRMPPGELARMKAVAANYGDLSGASSHDNPLLQAKGWYWVEVLRFDAAPPSASAVVGSRASLQPDAANPYVFRVTALAEGHRSATRVVLQSLVVMNPPDAVRRVGWRQLQ